MHPEAATRAEGADPMIGKVLDERYRIEAALGQGGIGRVYKARHLILGRHVALKVLLAQYESVPVLQERFRREAEALAALSHPNIVTVTDFGVAEGMPYLVMELLEGEDLASLVHREVLEPRRVFGIARQMLLALAYAHSRDLVHRDLKPHNVFVRSLGGGTDHVEVLDFGLARFVGDAANKGPKLTKMGALIGTPAYMAPEQASGEAVDARADIYAAGLVLFETMTGRKPFESRDPGEVLRAHLLSRPPRLGQADTGLQVSDALESIVARALAKSPAERFPGASEMLAALDALAPDAALRVGPRPPRDQPIYAVDATQPGVAMTRAGTPSTVRGRAPESSIHLPKSRFPLLIGVGCASGILLGAVLALGFFLVGRVGTDDEPPAPHPTEVAPPVAPPVPASSVVPPPMPVAPARPPPRNALEPPPADPPALRRAFDRTETGREVSRDERDALEAHFQETRDVRALLLLARARMRPTRALSEALPRYQQAHGIDPSVRGTPRMIEDLLEISCAENSELRTSARTFVRDAYGREAMHHVRALLERSDREIHAVCRNRSGSGRAHLQQLRDELAALPPS